MFLKDCHPRTILMYRFFQRTYPCAAKVLYFAIRSNFKNSCDHLTADEYVRLHRCKSPHFLRNILLWEETANKGQLPVPSYATICHLLDGKTWDDIKKAKP